MSGSESGWTDGLSPSAKLVVKVLEYRGSLTQKEIIEQSRLSGRTVRNALEQLQRAGTVEKGICIEDARQNRYKLTPPVADRIAGGD
ncbi:MarR family winged helix-turn-helix transcriptional regulator [Halococcus hamelinensis]|jgi:DNA-binding MarR family transcriptional regulator|uniref:HTH marR-type domain-containing protein n=1 Tax=Halococcus hamelinensis 100A6 TaxID=1132509 RepID=M0M771_9EURY|nr:MarR family winged helix-turn-helix transcriptional regulator [Halococcus hamelinensis]EMA41541.1 hypothetical protein C447_01765 [Halococcus hamelinensis 100A6]